MAGTKTSPETLAIVGVLNGNLAMTPTDVVQQLKKKHKKINTAKVSKIKTKLKNGWLPHGFESKVAAKKRPKRKTKRPTETAYTLPQLFAFRELRDAYDGDLEALEDTITVAGPLKEFFDKFGGDPDNLQRAVTDLHQVV